ncbi:MAG: hypothetical protein WAL63_09510 [Solirubrobacteraceae bacterium]
MNPSDLLFRKRGGWGRVPDVVSNLPRILDSSLAAANAARTALDSTLSAVDAAKANPRGSRSVKPEKSGVWSPIRGGLIVAGSAVAIGLGSAAISSRRRREIVEDDGT